MNGDSHWSAWPGNCLTEAPRRIPDSSVDLFITDPPYGIQGQKLHQHYNRDERYVVGGYIEVPEAEYPAFAQSFVSQMHRVLRPGGSFYIVSGWSQLLPILQALQTADLNLVNHLIWKYSFGVHTTQKYVTSHYHILYGTKPGVKPVFETHSRFGPQEKDPAGRSLLYRDLEDVWEIPRLYKPGKLKNKNELPPALLEKMIRYSSRPGDLVCDFFLGGFSTLATAHSLGRRGVGFEINPKAFALGKANMAQVAFGSRIREQPPVIQPVRHHQPWQTAELKRLTSRFRALHQKKMKLSEIILVLAREFQRGNFAVKNALKTNGLLLARPKK